MRDPVQGEGSQYRVLVVDDHALFRSALCTLLYQHSRELGIRELLGAPDGQCAIHATKRAMPDVVIMDIHMRRMGGLEATRLLLAGSPELPVILVTATPDEAILEEARALGALTVLDKGQMGMALIDLLRTIFH